MKGKIGVVTAVSTAFVFLVCLGTLLAAPIAAGPARTVSAEDPVTITYWHHNTGSREATLNQLIAEFNATNSQNITVVGVYAGGYNAIDDQVIDALQNNGALPHVVVAYPNSFADFARYGAVRFLDAYVADPAIGLTDTADFFPGVLDYYRLGEYGNQLAGLQNGRSIEVMYLQR